MFLKMFRKKIKGFADLLKYAALISESTILNKDGSLMTMYHFRGDDVNSSTASDLNRISLRVNQALKVLGDGWCIHVDAVRTAETYYPTNNHFPDQISQMIDDERRDFFRGATCYRTDQYLTVSYLPNFNTDRLIAAASGNKHASEFVDSTLKTFENTLAVLEDLLSSVLKLTRLGSYEREDQGQNILFSELLSAVHYMLTGLLHPIRIHSVPMYLDAALASQDLVGGLTPKIGDKYIGVVSLTEFPQESYPAMLNALNDISIEYRTNTRFIFLDKLSAMPEIDKKQKAWGQGTIKFIDKIFHNPTPSVNENALVMSNDAKDALAELESDYVGFGYITNSIMVLDEDLSKIEENVRNIRNILQNMGFGCRVESFNTLDAWLGSHPANTFANVRKPLCHTMNLSHLLPLATIWSGRTTSPCPFFPSNSPCLSVLTTGEGNSPFYYNQHVGDLGHTLITGATGSGKSTLLGHLATQFKRYPNAKIFCFDKGNSMEILCHAENGNHYDLDIKSTTLNFAPLQKIDDKGEFAWAVDWIEKLISLNSKITISPAQRNMLTESMQELASQPEHMRSLNNYHLIITAKDYELAQALKHYTIQGAMGKLLDSKSDNLDISNYMVFEIEAIMKKGDKDLLPVLLYIFHRIQNSLKGQPTLIIIDEAWVMLAHPIIKAELQEWFKVMRKMNCSVVLATQEVIDIINAGIFNTVAQSCPSKWFLADREAYRNEAIRSVYEKAGLNSREIQIIADAIPKRELYLKTPEGRRLVNLALLPIELAFIGHNSKEEIKLVRQMKDKNPDGWQFDWLEYLGVRV